MNKIYSQSDFRKLLVQEQARADRNSDIFSLAVFTDNLERPDPVNMLKCAQHINRKLRVYDEVGFIENNILGIMLPETQHEAAQTLLNKQIQSFKGEHSNISFVIFTYPHNWVPFFSQSSHNPDKPDENTGVRTQ